MDIDRLQAWLDDNGLEDIQVREQINEWLDSLSAGEISGYAQDAISFAQGAAFSFVLLLFSAILIVVISIYMLLDMQRLEQSIDSRFPPHGGAPLTQRIESALWGYLKGQAILSTVIGTSAGVGMYILGVTGLVEGAQEYALLFGLWTAFIEVIPYIGPWLSAVPPAIFALFADPPWGVVWVGLLFLFIYQVEGHIVVPNVMASALRLHPLLVIFGLLAGGALYGIAGRPRRAADDGRRPRDLGVLPRAGEARELGRRRWRGARRGRDRAAESGEPASRVFDAIVEAAAAESPLWGEAALPQEERMREPVFSQLGPDGHALGLETIYEGYLVHYGRSRLFAPPIATPRFSSATISTRTGSCASRRRAT